MTIPGSRTFSSMRTTKAPCILILFRQERAVRHLLSVVLVALLAGCGAVAQTTPTVGPTPSSFKPPAMLQLQPVDRAGVILFPTPWKQNNCWPLVYAPKPLSPSMPAKQYFVYGISYDTNLCGNVSQHSFSMKYGKEYPPRAGCTISVSYDGTRLKPYKVSVTGGGGLSCRNWVWHTQGTPPKTIHAVVISN